MADFTRLERAVMEALAWDLRNVAPDLAAQFEESLPGQRRNTGAGFSTGMIVSHRRPPPLERATGSYGSVHALVGDLAEPVAFKAQLRDGRLLALEADSYGQDMRDVDVSTVPFEQVFTIDDQGRSIEFDPRAHMKPGPLPDHQIHQDRPEPAPAPTLVNTGALQRVQERASRPDDLLSAIFGGRLVADTTAAPGDAPVPAEDQKSLLVAIAVGLLALALIAVALFRVPLPFAVVAGVVVARALARPPVMAAVGRMVRDLGRYSVRPGE